MEPEVEELRALMVFTQRTIPFLDDVLELKDKHRLDTGFAVSADHAGSGDRQRAADAVMSDPPQGLRPCPAHTLQEDPRRNHGATHGARARTKGCLCQ